MSQPMNPNQIRYMFEHQLMPSWFFDEKVSFINTLLNHREFLFDALNEIFRNEGAENPYTKEQFVVEPMRVTDEVFLMMLTYPKPEVESLCYKAFLVFDQNFEKTSFFCIEKGNEYDDGLPFVCGWTPSGSHNNYGTCTMKDNDDLLRCLDIHMEHFYNMKRQ